MKKTFGGYYLSCCIAAPHSGSGKTTITLALIRLLSRKGYKVQSFKCGPDYVDPSFLSIASGHPCHNLDTWLEGANGVRAEWIAARGNADIAICEGVMGLFDGRSPKSLEGSTADCARALNLPVILIVPAKGIAGSFAALVEGFTQFHPEVRITGIIANHVGSPRHAEILKNALIQRQLPPLIAALPHADSATLPSRQLGLIPAYELSEIDALIDHWANFLEQHWDEEAFFSCIQQTTLPEEAPSPWYSSHETNSSLDSLSSYETESLPKFQKKLAIARDEAFCFYYESNLNYLKKQGWELQFFSPLKDRKLPPDSDALYLGGGYPEQFAHKLSQNESLIKSIQQHASDGKEIFAECGGYMYLCEDIHLPSGESYPLCGIIKASAHMGEKLRSLGYREAHLATNILGIDQPILRGHEFHWSRIVHHEDHLPLYTYTDKEGNICHEGILSGSIKAGYIHLFWGHLSHEQGYSPTQSAPTHPEATSAVPPVEHKEKNKAKKLLNHQKNKLPKPQHKHLPIIVLNGASSSGKTSLAQAFIQECEYPYYLLSADDFLKNTPGRFSTLKEAETTMQWPLVKLFHQTIKEALALGIPLIIDHVVGDDPAWRDDLSELLLNHETVYIKVYCSETILLERESQRTDRPSNNDYAIHQARTIHHEMNYHHELDTSYQSSRQIARNLLNVLFPGIP